MFIKRDRLHPCWCRHIAGGCDLLSARVPVAPRLGPIYICTSLATACHESRLQSPPCSPTFVEPHAIFRRDHRYGSDEPRGLGLLEWHEGARGVHPSLPELSHARQAAALLQDRLRRQERAVAGPGELVAYAGGTRASWRRVVHPVDSVCTRFNG